MSRWLVTQENAQFAVEGLDELRRLAAAGDIDAADMVQPPGRAEWIYAGEVPELSRFFPGADTMDDEDDGPQSSPFALLGTILVGAVLLLVSLVGIASIGFFALNSGAPPNALGEGGLAFSQMLVTENKAPLYAEPDDRSAIETRLGKDDSIELLAKRGEFYKARTPSGEVGWVSSRHVLPMYLLGGGDVMAEYDPLYNPDRYVQVDNATWFQVDQKNAKMTVFRFMIGNDSKYPMTDVVLLAVIKDSKGNELERVEIPVEGVIPPGDSTTVGTFRAEKDAAPDEAPRTLTQYTFDEMAEIDPDLALQFTDGIEVLMKTEDFTEAKIDLLEVRAIPLG